jgi:hypothetical protein
MRWPFVGTFAPLREGNVQVTDPDGTHSYLLYVDDVGTLQVNSGRLLACDPLTPMVERVVVAVEPGTYPVRVTVADVSDVKDRSHLRVAYVSLVTAQADFASRKVLDPVGMDGDPEEEGFYGVGVDAGAVAFVDEVNLRTLFPGWFAVADPDVPFDEDVYDNAIATGPDRWTELLNAASPLSAGFVNVPLPSAPNDENIVICSSGWGDGVYPVIGTYDVHGNLTGVHIDLQVVGDFTD